MKDKKKIKIPTIKERRPSHSDIIKSLGLFLLFLMYMFVFPIISVFSSVPSYIKYITLFIFVIILNYEYYKKDFLIFKNNFSAYFPFIIKKYFKMLMLSFVVAIPIVFLNGGASSSNQQQLNDLFNKLPVYMILLSCVYAPLVEESIFRLNLSKLIHNKTLFVIISGLLFGTLHMINKYTSIYDLLYIVQYSTLGFCLAKAYKDANNIFVSISMHFMQNAISCIIMIIGVLL